MPFSSDCEVHAPPKEHLIDVKKWDLEGVSGDGIHLMAQLMETWIVADLEELAAFYGKGFIESAIPRAADLEKVYKDEVLRGLKRATEHTKKGQYHKINHASNLLALIRTEKVRSRCKHCDQFLRTISDLVA